MDKKMLLLAAALVIASASQALAEDLVVGKKLYVDNCQRCHGATGGGGIGKRLKGDAAYWDFPIFKRTLMEGIDDENKHMKIMPVWGKTGFVKPKGEIPTDAELQDIQAYLKTFGPAE
jgi:mono/diheme cytochrome c family protein